MSLIIATGSNLGDKKSHLLKAKSALKEHFRFLAESRIYESTAVDYLDQPNFYNQVLEFDKPETTDLDQVMNLLLEIEKSLGRERHIPRGPRTIDIDMLFFGTQSHQSKVLTLPHPRLFERSFVVLPLKELPYFKNLQNHYEFPTHFNSPATPI